MANVDTNAKTKTAPIPLLDPTIYVSIKGDMILIALNPGNVAYVHAPFLERMTAKDISPRFTSR
jgi:hypothetical protein